MPKWNEITQTEKYQSLPPEAKAEIKADWFRNNLLPEVERRPSLQEMGADKVFQWFMEQPDDTGQGYVSSMLGAAGRGFGEMVPGAVEGVGALTGSEGLREVGQDIRSGLESIAPVNPIYAESVPVKLAGVGGQIGSVLATAGAGGAVGKALGGVGAVSKGAQTAALGSAFLQGSAEGAREAEQYGMSGPEAYLRTLAGGVTEAGTELLPFGLGAETALAKRVLAGAPRTGTFLGSTLSEGGEEAIGQLGSNIATQALAPAGVETPGLMSGVLEAGAYGAAGGAMLGGINALITTPPEKQTDIQKSIASEFGGVPKDQVPTQTTEEKKAAMEAGGTLAVDPQGNTAYVVEPPKVAPSDPGIQAAKDLVTPTAAVPGAEQTAVLADEQIQQNEDLAKNIAASMPAPPAEPAVQPVEEAKAAEPEVTPSLPETEPQPVVDKEAPAGTPVQAAPIQSSTIDLLKQLEAKRIDAKNKIPQQPVETQENAPSQIPLEESVREEPQDRIESRKAEETGAGDQLLSSETGEEEVISSALPSGRHRFSKSKLSKLPKQVVDALMQRKTSLDNSFNFTSSPSIDIDEDSYYTLVNPATGESRRLTTPGEFAGTATGKNVVKPTANIPLPKGAFVVYQKKTPGGGMSLGVVEGSFESPKPAITPPGEPTTATEGMVTPGGVGAQRDTSKPEQMNPDELPNADAFTVEQIEQSAAFERDSKGQRMVGYGIRPEGMKVGLSPIQREQGTLINAAFEKKRPVSAAAVDTYGITLPSGYTRQGDLYIFQPTAAEKQTPPGEPTTATEGMVTPGGVATERDLSKPEQMNKFLSDLRFYGTAKMGGDQYTIKQASDDSFYIEKTTGGQRSVVASGFSDIEGAQQGAAELVSPTPEKTSATGQPTPAIEEALPERGASIETIASGGGMSIEEARQFLARKSDNGEPLIFGRPFSEISGMQQQERPRVLRTADKLRAIKQIVRDINKFKIPVSQEVVDTYGITLPEGYVKQGDLYVFQPQTKAAETLSASLQGNLPLEETPEQTSNRIKKQTIRFASGMSAIGDLRKGSYARAGHKNYGIGFDVGLLSKNAIKELADFVINLRTQVFIDSGAFSNFKKGLKVKSGDKQIAPLDFDQILAKYDSIISEIQQANEVEETDYPRPMLVMPDVIGNQAESLSLTERYKNWIAVEAAQNTSIPIIPIPLGELTLSQAYNKILDILNSNNLGIKVDPRKLVVGVPSNAEAISRDDLAQFLSESKPPRIHFLGAAADKNLNPLIEVVSQNSPTTQVTADASKVRSAILNGVSKGKSRGQAIFDALYQEDDPLVILDSIRKEPPQTTAAEKQTPVPSAKGTAVASAERQPSGGSIPEVAPSETQETQPSTKEITGASIDDVMQAISGMSESDPDITVPGADIPVTESRSGYNPKPSWLTKAGFKSRAKALVDKYLPQVSIIQQAPGQSFNGSIVMGFNPVDGYGYRIFLHELGHALAHLNPKLFTTPEIRSELDEIAKSDFYKDKVLEREGNNYTLSPGEIIAEFNAARFATPELGRKFPKLTDALNKAVSFTESINSLTPEEANALAAKVSQAVEARLEDLGSKFGGSALTRQWQRIKDASESTDVDFIRRVMEEAQTPFVGEYGELVKWSRLFTNYAVARQIAEGSVSPELVAEINKKQDEASLASTKIDRLVSSGAKPEEMDKFVKSLSDDEFNALVESEAFDVDTKLAIKPKDTYDAKRIKRRKFVDQINTTAVQARKTAEQIFKEEEAELERQRKIDERTQASLNSIIDPEKTNIVQGTVSAVDAESARRALNNSGEIPNAFLTRIYASPEAFLADRANQRYFPSSYARLQSEGNIEGLFERGQTLIFADKIGVSDLDRRIGKNLGISPEQAAARRVIAHENGHRSVALFTAREKREFLGYLRRKYNDAQIDNLVRVYSEYADWRTNLESRNEALEELFLKDFERLEKIPTGGLWDDIVQFLKRVWRRLTGRTDEPTLDNMKDVVRLLRNAMRRTAVPSFTTKDGGEVKLSYAGEKAIENLPEERRQFMRDSLETAKAMAAAGKDSEEIRAVTGWFPGKYDGKMRWELPDDGASLISTSDGNLESVLKHEELFSSYPSLSSVKVVFEPIKDFGGLWNRDSNTISILNSMSDGDKLNVLLHEVQHAIQDLEGFARGSNPSQFSDYTTQAQKRFDRFRDILDSLGDAVILKYNLRNGAANLGEAKEQFRKEFGREPHPESGQHAKFLTDEEIGREAELAQERLEQAAGTIRRGGPSVQYRKTAGEIEARDVQARQKLTPEQRAATAPYSSENIAPEDAIVLFGSGPQASVQFSSDTSAALSAGSEAARSTLYSERDMDIREAIRRAYEAMPKTNSVVVPIGELFAKTEELMPGVTQEEFSLVLQDLFEDNGAVLQEGDVVEPLTEQDRRYLTAVESGDLDAAQEFVDKAAGRFASMEEQNPIEFSYGDENDQFFYHVTTKDRLEQVVYDGEGLVPNKGGQFAGAAAQTNSRGKVFFTERSGVKVWMNQVEQQLENSRDYDEDQSPEDDLAVIRIPKHLVSDKQDDDPRNSPVQVGRDFFSTKPIPAWPETVVRDDQGRIIPLSRRFDTGADIRGQINVTTPEGKRAGFVVIMPKRAVASRVETEGEAVKSYQDGIEAIESNMFTAKFGGRKTKGVEPTRQTIKPNFFYKQASIQLVDDLLKDQYSIEDIANSLMSDEFLQDIGIKNNVPAIVSLTAEVKNRLSNEARSEKDLKRKVALEKLFRKLTGFDEGVGNNAGRGLGIRSYITNDPRYRWMYIYSKAEEQLRKDRELAATRVASNLPQTADNLQKTDAKVGEDAGERAADELEDNQDDIDLAEGEATLDQKGKTLWEKFKDLIRKRGIAMRALNALRAGNKAKASISSEERNAISQMSEEELVKFIAGIDKEMADVFDEFTKAPAARKKREKMVATAKKRAEQGKPIEPKQSAAKGKLSGAEQTAQNILKDLSERYADPNIYTDAKRAKINEMRELYKKRVKQGVGPEQMSEQDFVSKAVSLGANKLTAETLWKAAELEIEAREAMRQEEVLGKITLEKLQREISALRPGEKAPFSKQIPWRKLLSQKASTVEAYRQRIFDTISSEESLADLDEAQKAKLADLLTQAWESKRKAILDRMVDNAINQEEAAGRLTQEGADALRSQRQKLVEDINLGILDEDRLMKHLADKFGIKSEFTEAERANIDRLLDILQDDKLNEVKRNKAAYELLEALSSATKIPIAKLLADYWVSSVLSGVNTAASIAMAVMSGGYELTTGAFRILRAGFTNPKELPAEIAASFKAMAEFLKAFGREGRLAWQYLVTGDRAFLDPSMNTVLNDLNYDSIGKTVSLAEKMAKSDKIMQRVMGIWMRSVSRLLTALDSFNSGVTKAGALPIVFRQLNLSAEDLQRATEKYNLQLYRDKVIQRDFNGNKPNNPRDKALVDSYAKAEMMADLQEFGKFSENADFFGQQGAMTLDPTGVGGFIYSSIKSLTGGATSRADKFLAEAEREWKQADGANKTAKGLQLAFAYFLQFGAYNSANLAGLRFARFAGNKFNQGLSFIPGIGMLRMYEATAKDSKIEAKDAFTDMIMRNQLAGLLLSLAGFAVIQAIMDEPDDEKRGWFINGGWANLTPDRKQQKLAAGQKEFTIGIGGKVYNYQSWPISPILAAIGSLSDLARYSREQWNEKSIADRLISAAASGVFSAGEIPALSGFQTLFGNNLSSKDPNEKRLDRFAKVMAGWGGGFVPRILKDIDFMTDPGLRKYESLWEQTASHIPVYRRYSGEEYYDILGKQIERKVWPGSREFMELETDPEYRTLGKLNSRGIWLTPANAEHRMVGKGRFKRKLTQEEADAYSLETGKGYRQMLLRYGSRLEQMPTERARAFLMDKADEVRDRALQKITR